MDDIVLDLQQKIVSDISDDARAVQALLKTSRRMRELASEFVSTVLVDSSTVGLSRYPALADIRKVIFNVRTVDDVDAASAWTSDLEQFVVKSRFGHTNTVAIDLHDELANEMGNIGVEMGRSYIAAAERLLRTVGETFSSKIESLSLTYRLTMSPEVGMFDNLKVLHIVDCIDFDLYDLNEDYITWVRSLPATLQTLDAPRMILRNREAISHLASGLPMLESISVFAFEHEHHDVIMSEGCPWKSLRLNMAMEDFQIMTFSHWPANVEYSIDNDRFLTVYEDLQVAQGAIARLASCSSSSSFGKGRISVCTNDLDIFRALEPLRHNITGIRIHENFIDDAMMDLVVNGFKYADIEVIECDIGFDVDRFLRGDSKIIKQLRFFDVFPDGWLGKVVDGFLMGGGFDLHIESTLAVFLTDWPAWKEELANLFARGCAAEVTEYLDDIPTKLTMRSTCGSHVAKFRLRIRPSDIPFLDTVRECVDEYKSLIQRLFICE